LFFITATLLFGTTTLFAQSSSDASQSLTGTDYWVAYWVQPQVALFGAEQQAFQEAMQPIMFPWNNSVDPSNPDALDKNVQWLKDHPSVRFKVDGYASSRGELIYNLLLSKRRADWVKEKLVSQGISEERIVMAVGWGQLYPVCPELTQECWDKNRLVRFSYAPQ
jgi:outer membrane protein OmpA-like peptidoglycan-associated protein